MMNTSNIDIKRLVLFIIFIILLISNITLFGLLTDYVVRNKIISVSFDLIHSILVILSTIIILGFISTRLPKFRGMGDSSIYEISYLIFIGVLSIVISYFNKSIEVDNVISPFIYMFEVLSILLIFIIISTKTKPFKRLLHRNPSKFDLLISCMIFTFIACLASGYQIEVDDSYTTINILIVMVAGLFGGPFVGIPTGIITGGFNYLYGGPFVFSSTLSVVIAGFIGSIIHICNDGKFPKEISASALMFLYVGFYMLLTLLLTPPYISVNFVADSYPLLLFGSVLGIILFIMIIKEQKPKKDYEDLKIKELENTLDTYEDKIEQLEEDIEFLKNKVKKKNF